MTLIEIISVVAVIAFIILLVVPAISASRLRAFKTEDASKLRQMAQATLLYHATEGRLPGRLNRAVRVPEAVLEGQRDRWFSTFMADAGLLPADDRFWQPVVDYGIGASGHGYILNNTIHSSPGNFFGRRSNDADLVHAARQLSELRSNLSAVQPDEESLAAIWMITNLDGANYDVTATAGSDFSVEGSVRTPWGGRHYAFFDGRVAFIEEGNYPSRD